ncbi:MAG: amino acid--tRNA ligase-related protein [Thermotogota bacterium]|nr:amino acid--tRNA ligase-related protein [Thermotogota bacterium]
MAKKSERKRVFALENDSFAYRREVPRGSIEVDAFGSLRNRERATLVGRLMLFDNTGEISKLGVFSKLDDKEVISFERIEGNGSSIPAFLARTPENIKMVNSMIHYGDIVMLDGVKIGTADGDVFLGEKVLLLSKATGDVYDSNIDFRKRSNLYAHRHLQVIRDREKILHFRKCSTVFRVIRQFLYGNGYEELNMTLLQESFEAGLADPFVTHVTEHDKDMYLRLTSELFLRKLMIAGFSKVFEIGKSFRNQGSTVDMLPQFTILELYRAYATREEMENLMRDMICEILVQLYGSTSIPTTEGSIDCAGEWPSCDFNDELEKCTGLRYDESCPIEELVHLLDKVGIAHPAKLNKYTVATSLYAHVMSKITGPVFLRNLPAAQSPLFKVNDDGSTVDETLLVINGMLVADLVNPERDPRIIKRRMEEQLSYRRDDQDGGVNEDIIEAMRFGLPPCRGIGMGIERLLMLLLNAEDIRDVELFPVF